jgi:3-phenylpropionate/trans-cinnamate dioxygenase ferredoxin reductase component
VTSAGTVIVGTGQAGFQTAASLRSEGYQEPITLIGDEPHIPYQRPPLSKGFPLGKLDLPSFEFRPAKFYTDHKIDLITSQPVRAIERRDRHVFLKSGSHIPYDKLVLAVGARNRMLNVPGADLNGVLYLRSLDEAITLKSRLAGAQQIVVIGGGFVGLELAAVAAILGKSVTVVEALPRLMSRVVAPAISQFFTGLHAAEGVKILCGATVTGIVGDKDKASGVKLSVAATLPADLVLVGIGIEPNIDLAQHSGLSTSNGIVVDDHLLTEDENIYAIGDCAAYPCAFAFNQRLRLESVQNAADQAQHVAAAIVGRQEPYRALPWFWTDQFDIKLQMAGLSCNYDHIVTRGSAESKKLSVFYFAAGRLVAIDSINRPLDHMIGRKLIAAGTPVTFDQAADESLDLRTLTPKPPPT